jgi:hypothetical protein
MEKPEVSVPSKADRARQGPTKPLHGWHKLPPEIIGPLKIIKSAEEVEDE